MIHGMISIVWLPVSVTPATSWLMSSYSTLPRQILRLRIRPIWMTYLSRKEFRTSRPTWVLFLRTRILLRAGAV
ncbi:hypothetical protein FB45DRAFT_899541, partial [Roridomyces roridus]